jgi:hypothetical protein
MTYFMVRSSSLLVLPAIMAGCSTLPDMGAYYEKRATKERVQVVFSGVGKLESVNLLRDSLKTAIIGYTQERGESSRIVIVWSEYEIVKDPMRADSVGIPRPSLYCYSIEEFRKLFRPVE